MGIFNWFGKTQKEPKNSAIALDIGTEFVKALVFKVEDDKAVVLGAARQKQQLSDMAAGAVTDINGVVKNCEKALAEAAEMANELPEQVIIGIAGELVKGMTTSVRYIRPNPKEKITLEELRDIIARVQRRAFDRVRSVLAWETGHSEIDVRLVNAAIVDIVIDGYKIVNPIGFQGREVQVGVFNAFAPIVHLGALQTIADSLDLDLLSIVVEPYAVAKSVAPDESAKFSAIFIDVGGGTTDVAVVRAGGVEGTKMFALGGRAFTRRISGVFGIPFSQAEKMKIDYSHGELNEEKAEIVKKAIDADCEVWFSGIQLTLGEFSDVELLPSKILLCGGGTHLPDIKDILETGNWSKKLPFAKKPTVKFITPKEVINVLDQTGKLTQPQDVTPMALANLAIELVGEETLVDNLLSKVAKGLGR